MDADKLVGRQMDRQEGFGQSDDLIDRQEDTSINRQAQVWMQTNT